MAVPMMRSKIARKEMVFPPPRNPDDLGIGPLVLGITWTLTGMAVIAVCLRMHLGRRNPTGIQADDWLMFVAAALQVVAQCFYSVGFQYGFGKHDADLRMPDELVTIVMWDWMATIPGMLVSVLARISIAILLLRLFGVRRWFRWYLLILTALQVLGAVLIFIFTWVRIDPVEALWNPFLPNIRKWNRWIHLSVMIVGQTFYSIADLSYIVFPVIFIWRLNMALRQRLSLCIVMALSTVTFIFSILKTIAIPSTGPEPQYNATLTVLWASGEQATVILLGCIPSLRAASKINMAAVSSFASSLSRIFSTMSGSTRADSNADSSAGSFSEKHHNNNTTVQEVGSDIQENTHKLGELGRAGLPSQSRGAWAHKTSSESMADLIAQGKVLRTDDFTINYSQGKHEKRA